MAVRGEVVSQEQIANLLADQLPKLTEQPLRVLAALYGANRPLSVYALLGAVPPMRVVHKDAPAFADMRGTGNIRVWIKYLRDALSKDAIRTVRLEGYELTAEGRRKVTSLLTRHATAA